MKTTKLQLNATSFKATRNTISAYFGAKYDLAIELDKAKKATSALSKVITEDKAQLSALALGLDEVDGYKILRTKDEILESLKTNTTSYNALVKPYNDTVEKVTKAINEAIALFDNKDSALYKAYVAYVTDTTDDNYNAYADAMAKHLVSLGLSDATADNVAHYMPNADRELKGKTAVKKGDIQGALNSKAFANAVLRKVYVQSKDSFSSKKFTDYVRKCADKAKKNK